MLNKNLKFKTPNDGHYFFGYYDKSPFDFNNQKLLAMKVRFMGRMPDKEDVLEIGCFDWQNNNNFIKLAETKTWNWQQGCMLQWVGPDLFPHCANHRQCKELICRDPDGG